MESKEIEEIINILKNKGLDGLNRLNLHELEYLIKLVFASEQRLFEYTNKVNLKIKKRLRKIIEIFLEIIEIENEEPEVMVFIPKIDILTYLIESSKKGGENERI